MPLAWASGLLSVAATQTCKHRSALRSSVCIGKVGLTGMARAGRGCSWENIWARNSLHQPLLSPFSLISMLPPPQTTLISPFPSSYFLHRTPQKSGTDPRCPSPASCKVSHSPDCDPSICEVAWRDVLGDFISLVGAGAGNALLLPLEGPS